MSAVLPFSAAAFFIALTSSREVQEIASITSLDDIADGIIVVEFEHPICIMNAPMKASSKSTTNKITIFIDGQLIINQNGEPHLQHAKSSVSFFKIETAIGDGLCARLIDVAHFDMEELDGHKSFHPVFHVQRGWQEI